MGGSFSMFCAIYVCHLLPFQTVDGRTIRVDEAGKSGGRSGGFRGSGGRGFFRGGRGRGLY